MDKMQPKRLVKSQILTKGFAGKESLADSAVLQALEAHLIQESGIGRHVLVVAFEFDKARFFLFMFLIALLGLAISVLVAAPIKSYFNGTQKDSL